MARRVNTRFLIILTLAIGGVAVPLLVAGVVYQKMRKDPAPYIQKAEAYLEQGDLEQAARNYAQAASLSPRDPALRITLGDTLMQLTRLDTVHLGRARHEWERALEIDPGYTPALNRLLDLYVTESQLLPRADATIFDRIRSTAERLVRIDPEDHKARAAYHVAYLRGWQLGLATESRHIDEAVQTLTALLEEDPDNADLPFHLAQVKLHQAQDALRRNQPAQASRLVSEAVALFEGPQSDGPVYEQPDNPEMHWRAAQVHLAAARGEQRNAELRQEWLARARALAQEAQRLAGPEHPQYVEINLLAASISPLTPGGEAEQIYRALHASRPDDQSVRLHLARFLGQHAGTRAEAIALLEKPPVAGPDVIGIRALVHQHLETQTIVELSDLRMKAYAAETDPARREVLGAGIEQGITRVQNRLGEIPAVLKLRGEMHLLRNQPVEAIQALTRAVTLQTQQNDPPDPQILFSLARAHVAVQQNEQAVRLLRQVLGRNDRFVPAHLMLAELLLRSNRADEARPHIDLLEQVLPEEPDVIRLRLATMNVATDQAEIERYYERLPETTPQRRLQKGQVAIVIGKLDEAERLLSALVQEQPQNLQAVEMLIRLYAQRDQREDAMAVLVDAQQHHPNHQGLELLRRQLQDASPEELVEFVTERIGEIADDFAREIQFAVLYRDRGDVDRSLRHLSNAHRLKPEDPQILEMLFTHHLQAREWDQARRYMEQLARGGHDQAGGLLYRYRLAMARGEIQSAIGIARDLTQRMPEFSQSWLSLAQALQASGQLDSAVTNYLRALEFQGSNFDALKGLVECYVGLGRVEDAGQQIARGRRAFPTRAFFIEQEINHELNYGDPDKALERLTQALERDREQSQSWLALGRAHVRAAQLRMSRGQGERAMQHFTRARELFGEAMEKWPDESAFYAFSAELALAAEQPEEARQVLSRLAAREQWQQRPEPHMFFADYYLRTNKPEEAEVALRQALRKAGEDQEQPIRSRLANLLAQMQKVDAALQMLESRRTEPQVARQRIEMLINVGRNEPAERELQEAITREPQAADLLTLLGLVQLNLQRPADAITTLDRALAIEAERPQALYLRALGKLRLPQRDIEGAIRDLSIARNRDPNNLDFRFALAEAYQVNQQVNNGVRELVAALGVAPQSKPVRLKLLELYSGMQPPRWLEVERLLRDARNDPQIGQDPDWWHAEAMMWAARDDLDRALSAVEQAREAQPGNPVYLQNYLGLLLQTERYQRLVDETDELVEQFAETPGIHRIHQLRGVARRHLDDREGALADFQLALNAASAQRDDAAAVDVVNTIVREIGVDEALERIGERVEQDDRWKLVAAQLHFARQDQAQAVSLVEQVLARFDDLSEPDQLNALRVAGTMYLSAQPRQVDNAHQTYLRLLERSPDDIVSLNNMAYLLVEYMDPPRPEQALNYSRRAFEQMQQAGVTEPLVMDTHGWVLTRAGFVEEGIAVLHQAADKRSFPEVHYHLGEAYLKSRLADQARTQLLRATQLIEEKENDQIPVDPGLKQNVQRALLRAEEMAQTRLE